MLEYSAFFSQIRRPRALRVLVFSIVSLSFIAASYTQTGGANTMDTRCTAEPHTVNSSGAGTTDTSSRKQIAKRIGKTAYTMCILGSIYCYAKFAYNFFSVNENKSFAANVFSLSPRTLLIVALLTNIYHDSCAKEKQSKSIFKNHTAVKVIKTIDILMLGALIGTPLSDSYYAITSKKMTMVPKLTTLLISATTFTALCELIKKIYNLEPKESIEQETST